MKRFATVLAAIVLCSVAHAQGLLPYQDVTLSPEERAADLVSRLTIQEKAGLSMNTSLPVERLGIKGYNWWSEALHGVARNGAATTFPQPTGMAASFDDALLYEVFTAVSDEGRVKFRASTAENDVQRYRGITFWTPNINIFRDPRWGRGMETYGEDPYLTSVMGQAVVRGLQGPDSSSVRKAHACAKHYAVHSGPESTRHSFDVDVSQRDLHETYLPGFKDLVMKAKVEEVMTAYQRFRGIPCGASPYLIDTLLRGRWGYEGMITSDCGAVQDFWVEGRHGYSEDVYHAVAEAVKAGMDTECGGDFIHIPEAVEMGLLDEADLDRNLIRLLAARYRLGEMDGIDPWKELPDGIVEGPEHKALALKMAEESLVLLQNDGILPLQPGTKIALIGPNADDAVMQWGNYAPVPKETVTLKDGLEKRFPGMVYNRACGILGSELHPGEHNIRGVKGERFDAGFFPTLDIDSVLVSLEGIETIVFAGGISPSFEGEQMGVYIPGFYGGDRTDIELPAVQRELLSALHKAGKKIVLVNFSGGAVGLVPELANCNAILQAWYPGQMGGEAIAEVLCGEVVPSGKLPVTFYASADQLPDFGNYDMKGHTYRFFEGKPAFAFGHGLSYTTFKYGRPRIRRDHLVVRVRNTGKTDATEVVQMYLRRPDDPEGPLNTLRAFKRVKIRAGRSKWVKIPLTEETFLWWSDKDDDMVYRPGKYVLSVGGSSDALRSVKVTAKR